MAKKRFFLNIILLSIFIFSCSEKSSTSKPSGDHPEIKAIDLKYSSASIPKGGAVQLTAMIEGEGDFMRDVIWSFTPESAGIMSNTGLWEASDSFTGQVEITVTAKSKPSVKQAVSITVDADGSVLHVDSQNTGTSDGSALHPFKTISDALAALNDNTIIKVANGNSAYTENISLPPSHTLLLLGGYNGGSSADYASGKAGDFFTRNTSLSSNATHIQGKTSSSPVIMSEWVDGNFWYVIDGFVISGGINGIMIEGGSQVNSVVSRNRIENNGALSRDRGTNGGGIKISGIPAHVLGNLVQNNKSGMGGGMFYSLDTATFIPFLIADNIIDSNTGGADHCGGICISAYRGYFTRNTVSNNKANDLEDYGWAGGLLVMSPDGGVPSNPNIKSNLEFSFNKYFGNVVKSYAGGLFVDQGANVILRHELIYDNQSLHDGGAGAAVDGPNSLMTMINCTVSDNRGPDNSMGNGVLVDSESKADILNTIFWNNSISDAVVRNPEKSSMTIKYSNVKAEQSETPAEGEGNIYKDPYFVNAETRDYHLKSVEGTFNPATNSFEKHLLHSPSIDSGDISYPYSDEQEPNGKRVNMGAYGNTPEASKSKQ